MYISHVQNGVYELQQVGYDWNRDRQSRLDKFIAEHRKDGAIAIACLIPSQVEAIEFLKRNKFKQIGEPSCNPNHANHKNYIFAREIKKARKKVK